MDAWFFVFFLLFITPAIIDAQDKRCDVPADVVFVMDSSDSIKDNEWEQEKNFVSVLIDNLHVDRHAIHVGVITYSTDIGMVIDLQPFKTKDQLKNLLQQAVHINLGTGTAKAIAKLIELSDTQGRIEGDAKQIGVIITDGRSTDVSATIREAGRARNLHNIDMIALGVGNETFLEELKAIAGSESRLFQVQNFSQLRDVVKQLEDIICEIVPSTTTPVTTIPTTTTTLGSTTSPFVPPFPCSKPADIVFVIDGSYSITPSDWIKGKQFVSYLINSLDIGEESIHVGLVVYGSNLGNIVPLSPYKNKLEMKAAASALIQPPVGRTNTALGIKTANDMIRDMGRPQNPNILIVITDGKSSNPSETKDQASLAKRQGITIFVVGVGNEVMKEEMEDMATSAETMFDAPDFKHLVGMVQVLRDKICIAIQENTTLSTSIMTTTPVVTTQAIIPDLCKQCLTEGGVGFNPMPDDCEKYVLCLPVGATYKPVIKSCPFGMFWSHEAVSCLDARYVDCPADKCKKMTSLKIYQSSSNSPNCRSYFQCVNSKSSPACCEVGFRYREGPGCVPDPSCQDSCPLEVTIYNQGACQFRPDQHSYYSYYEVIPGQGNIQRNCKPGQVYSPKLCACTFDVSQVLTQIGCLPSTNLTFDGHFDDSSSSHQHIEIKGVGLSNSGSAVFTNHSFISIPNTVNQNLGDKLIIRLKFRVHRQQQPDQFHTANNWGFQNWFKNSSMRFNRTEFRTGGGISNWTDSSHIPGSEAKPLEVITIAQDGTIIQDPQYAINTNMTWMSSGQPTGHIIYLGRLGNSSSLMRNGILYMNNGKGKVLIQEPQNGSKGSSSSKWRIVSTNANGTIGTVEESGEGSLPEAIQVKYGFQLQPAVVQKWAILAPGGIVLQKGEGVIPSDVMNRYAGLSSGTLVKLFEQGENIGKWEISKPDGSDAQQGTGSIPKNLTDSLKLSSVFTPKQTSAIWSILSVNGDILESGQGTSIPAAVLQKYTTNPMVTILKSTSKDGSSSVWELSRADGSKLLQGHGALPQGISDFIKGEIVLPQIATVTGWRVQLPSGEVKTGTGPVPQDILDLYQKMSSSSSSSAAINKNMAVLPDQMVFSSSSQLAPGEVSSGQTSSVSQKWEVKLPNGSIQTGTGPLPADLLSFWQGQQVSGDVNGGQISNINQKWEVKLPNESVQTGSGALPADLLSSLRGQGFVAGGQTRVRRAAGSFKTMDVVSNCGGSVQLVTTDKDITMTLKTSNSPSGVTIDLPVHEGMNDVWLKYDGQQLSGIVNGYVRKKPLTGNIVTSSMPFTVGHCPGREEHQFIGDIDLLEIFHCLP